MSYLSYLIFNRSVLHCFSDIEKIQAGIGDKLALFLQGFSTFIAGFVIGYVISWKLALVLSIMLPMLIVLGALIAKVVS
jgi:ABC-type multidrug transport system fused ATPase/permease subunit